MSDGTSGLRLGTTGIALAALAVLGILLAIGSLVLLAGDDGGGTAAGEGDADTAQTAPSDAPRTEPGDGATGDSGDRTVEADDGGEGEGAEAEGDGETTAGTVEADDTEADGRAIDDASLDDGTVELDPPTGTDPTASSTTTPAGPTGGNDPDAGSEAGGNGSNGPGASGEGGCKLAVAELNGQAGTVTGIGSGDCAGIEVTTRSVSAPEAVTAVDWPTEIMLCERHPSAAGITVTATIGDTATELVDAYVRGTGSTDGPLTAIELTFTAEATQQPAIQPILVCRTTDAEAAIIRRSGS